MTKFNSHTWASDERVVCDSYHCLDHVWPLCPKVFDCVKDIHNALCLHSLYGCTQSTEGTGSANSSTGRKREMKGEWEREGGWREGGRSEGRREGGRERERREMRAYSCDFKDRVASYLVLNVRLRAMNIPAVNNDGFVPGVLLCAYDLVNEVNHACPRAGGTTLWPWDEMVLLHCEWFVLSRLCVLWRWMDMEEHYAVVHCVYKVVATMMKLCIKGDLAQ